MRLYEYCQSDFNHIYILETDLKKNYSVEFMSERKREITLSFINGIVKKAGSIIFLQDMKYIPGMCLWHVSKQTHT